MSESWLEIGDEELDAQEIQRRVEERMARRDACECERAGAGPRSGSGAGSRTMRPAVTGICA